MSEVRLPKKIAGEWIWLASESEAPESALIFHYEFVSHSSGENVTLWLSAKDSYQLFVNRRFVGFGPRKHTTENCSYIDQHEITWYLEAGRNELNILVKYNREESAGTRPGLWCQLASRRGIITATDRTWQVRVAEEHLGNRARLIPSRQFTQLLRPAGKPQWRHPDSSLPIGGAGGIQLELHPLTPPELAGESLNFTPLAAGSIEFKLPWTQVTFPSENCNGKVSAASCCLFCEEEQKLEISTFSDDPVKLFCNRELVLYQSHTDGEKAGLSLHPGWNQLLLFQQPSLHSKGFLMIFPGTTPPGFRIYQDSMAESPEAWNVTEPLSLTLGQATPPIHVDRFHSRRCTISLAELNDPAPLLENAGLFEQKLAPDMTVELYEGCYQIFGLDKIKYGFLRLVLLASEGDVADLSFGILRKDSGLPVPGQSRRHTATMVCHAGENLFLSEIPLDCRYVMVSMRCCSDSARVQNIAFEELQRPIRHEAVFNCADSEFNRLWEIGCQTLHRFAARSQLHGGDTLFGEGIINAYANAVNMAAVYGDFDYAASRLRQLVSTQQENGDIPMPGVSGESRSHFIQLFFFPVWISYNYQFSANLVELERTIPALDLLLEFLENMLDENGLLVEPELRLGVRDETPQDSGRVDTVLNALFCRFLLSAAELYRIVDQQSAAKHCMQLLQKISAVLTLNNRDAESGLYASCQLDYPEAEFSLWSTFAPLLGGVYPLEEFEKFFYRYFNFNSPFDLSEEAKHPFFNFLFLETMFALKQHDWALRYFKEYWLQRIDEKSGEWATPPESPLFHGGGSITPNIFLLREVLGIRIAEAGHEVVFFKPAFAFLKWAEGILPMAHGQLKVSWKVLDDGGLEVYLDSSIPLMIVPELSHEQLRNTDFHLSETVTLLDPPDDLVEED